MGQKTQLYGVVGAPISHSQSPKMFTAAFASTPNINAAYVRIAASSAEQALALAASMNLRGMNVTAPFKEAMIPLMNSLTPIARRLSAVNTITFADGHLRGHNTDPAGPVGIALDRGLSLDGTSCVVMGPGGAGRAAALGLTQAGAQVILLGRDKEKTQSAATICGCKGDALSAIEDHLSVAKLLISCLPPSVDPLAEITLPAELIVLDAAYQGGATEARAIAAGCELLPGKGWLLHQGLAGFEFMLGLTAPKQAMAQALSQGTQKTRPRSIALIGFMGAGKTTCGLALSQRLGWPFIDIDQLIQERTSTTIPQLLSRGIEVFRDQERQALGEVAQGGPVVIAAGGGLPVTKACRDLLSSHFSTAWLWASPETCMDRARGSARPLMPDSLEQVTQLLGQRISAYSQAADLVVSSEQSPEEVAEVVASEVG
jgi:shikimate dehydrogenase